MKIDSSSNSSMFNIYQRRKNGSFHEWDFGTVWTQLGSQKFKTEELLINVAALGAQEKVI